MTRKIRIPDVDFLVRQGLSNPVLSVRMGSEINDTKLRAAIEAEAHHTWPDGVMVIQMQALVTIAHAK